MPNALAPPRATQKEIALKYWARRSGLDGVLDEFLTVTQGPADGRCLITVCEHVQRTLGNFEFWSAIDPFQRWVPLVDMVVRDSALLQQKVGAHLYPIPRKNRKGDPINFLRGKITEYPIFAMLTDEHQGQPARYGSLQLHVVLARWLEAERKVRELKKAGKQLTLLEVLKLGRDNHDRPRVTLGIAKAVRDLSLGDFNSLLDHLKPELDPEKFREHLAAPGRLPSGNLYQEHFDVIRFWCLKDSGARVGGHHTPGDSRGRRPTFAEYVGYGDLRLGVNLPVEEGQSGQETILNRAGNDEDTFQLGLHPLERSGGDTTIRSDEEGAENTGEANSIGKSRSRHFEINRRLFPWSNDQLRVEEFRRGILPALARARHSESRDELEIATLVAIMIDTGREADQVLAMPIEKNPNAWLCYQRPSPSADRGAYYWTAIEPQYKTIRVADADREVARASYLRFPASALVTQLVEKFLEKAKFGSGKMFRQEKDRYQKALSEWLISHDCTGRATARRLANLRWDSLHRLTGGDLATCCLTLGVGESIAAVELHYAVLHVFEARAKFEESSRLLWGEHFGTAPVDYDDASPEEAEKIIGIRAFPRLGAVRDIVSGLRAGSRAFFEIPANGFDFARHAALLNRAVLYVTWHQMHAFATRAIVDAYQKRSLFSNDGIATLRDKDFEDGHKARMVWADPILLAHMEAIEKKLGTIRMQTTDKTFPENAALWFVSEDGAIEEITPTTIAQHLGPSFPFPVNTPRKVMRYLLRVRGLSHENAETYMGHWWQAREPWSPFSTFAWDLYLEKLRDLVPAALKDLGFLWPPEEPAS